jgi:outer membrane lipopolysaccharide assembly protein LptE/RlpB
MHDLVKMDFMHVRYQDVESPPSLKEAQEEVCDSISENDKGILGKSPEKEIIESEVKPLRVCKRYTTLSRDFF